jgi:hypothetical protein
MSVCARALIPPIRRARGYRLYGSRRRYLDLWQDDGHALLGHRPNRVKSVVKQSLDRGLLAAYPTVETARVERALSVLLGDRRGFRWYYRPERFRSAVSEFLGAASRDFEVIDPAGTDGPDRPEAPVMLWRPWISDRSADAPVVLPVVPFPGSGWLTFVATKSPLDPDFHPSDAVSPCWLAGISRAIYDLVDHLGDFDASVFDRFDSPHWDRTGPYLRLRCREGEFLSVYRNFLDRGMILSPYFGAPSIVPAEFDPGELGALSGVR